jgi:hypothetical protein
VPATVQGFGSADSNLIDQSGLVEGPLDTVAGTTYADDQYFATALAMPAGVYRDYADGNTRPIVDRAGEGGTPFLDETGKSWDQGKVNLAKDAVCALAGRCPPDDLKARKRKESAK